MMLGLKKQAKQITKLSINSNIFMLKLIEENRWTEFAKNTGLHMVARLIDELSFFAHH